MSKLFLFICIVTTTDLFPTPFAHGAKHTTEICQKHLSKPLVRNFIYRARVELHTDFNQALHMIRRWYLRVLNFNVSTESQIPMELLSEASILSGLHFDNRNLQLESYYVATPPRRLVIRAKLIYSKAEESKKNNHMYIEIGLAESDNKVIVHQNNYADTENAFNDLNYKFYPNIRISSEILKMSGTGISPLSYSKDNVADLAELILNNNSALPIVYVSASRRTGLPLIDVNQLAERLAGIAYVVTESEPLESELAEFLPREVLSWNGGIRVYPVGGANANTEGSIRGTRIEELDLLKIVRTIETLIFRRHSASYPLGETYSLELLRKEVLESSAEYQLSQSNQEIANLVAQSRADQERHQRELQQIRSQMELERLRAEIAESRANELEQNLSTISQQLGEATATLGRISSVPPLPQDTGSQGPNLETLFSAIASLPQTPLEAVHAAQALFSTRLFFTDRALRSAKNTAYQDTPGVWRALVSMADILHSLYFQTQESIDIRKEFQRRTGLELAISERGSTNDSSRLRALRQDTYMGRQIDISAHVKLTKRGQHLRIHFYVDRETNRIIIAHVGDHLETLGTQRM
jgi:hypothetical protein